MLCSNCHRAYQGAARTTRVDYMLKNDVQRRLDSICEKQMETGDIRKTLARNIWQQREHVRNREQFIADMLSWDEDNDGDALWETVMDNMSIAENVLRGILNEYRSKRSNYLK